MRWGLHTGAKQQRYMTCQSGKAERSKIYLDFNSADAWAWTATHLGLSFENSS